MMSKIDELKAKYVWLKTDATDVIELDGLLVDLNTKNFDINHVKSQIIEYCHRLNLDGIAYNYATYAEQSIYSKDETDPKTFNLRTEQHIGDYLSINNYFRNFITVVYGGVRKLVVLKGEPIGCERYFYATNQKKYFGILSVHGELNKTFSPAPARTDSFHIIELGYKDRHDRPHLKISLDDFNSSTVNSNKNWGNGVTKVELKDSILKIDHTVNQTVTNYEFQFSKFTKNSSTEGISCSYIRSDGIHRFECTCTTFDHNVRFEVDPDMGHISISVPLNHWLPWWKRVWLAVKYVFKCTERYGHYDTVELNPHDYDRIRALLDDSLEKMRKL